MSATYQIGASLICQAFPENFAGGRAFFSPLPETGQKILTGGKLKIGAALIVRYRPKCQKVDRKSTPGVENDPCHALTMGGF